MARPSAGEPCPAQSWIGVGHLAQHAEEVNASVVVTARVGAEEYLAPSNVQCRTWCGDMLKVCDGLQLRGVCHVV